ncbi:MAG: TetR/AcrR family transcriptional regulator [Planctomycetota bacterium]|jgi:AcrR family transcriptional regulator
MPAFQPKKSHETTAHDAFGRAPSPGPAPFDAAQPDPARPSAGQPRPHLSRKRVLAAALVLADERGLEALSMRRLGQSLGVEAMSLYRHVANKDAILDALVETVFGEIPPSTTDEPWRTALDRRAHFTLKSLRRHPWAIALLNSRWSDSAAALGKREELAASLRRRGFSPGLAARSCALIDSYVYGYALQCLELPASARRARAESPAPEALRDLQGLRGDDDLRSEEGLAGNFDWGLELLLEGLERRRLMESEG